MYFKTNRSLGQYKLEMEEQLVSTLRQDECVSFRIDSDIISSMGGNCSNSSGFLR
jgi:hypothetical protein